MTVDGVSLDGLVGGYGVARAPLLTAGHLGLAADQATAVVQGFGSIGGAAARYLARAGANLPPLPDAEAEPARRGIPVVPDFIANVTTNAWWWWVVFGDIDPNAEASFAKIDRVMRRLVDTVESDSRASGRTFLECALDLAARNAQALTERVGIIG